MRHMHSDKSIGAAMLRSLAWFAFGAALIGATILADVAFDLVFLEGDIRRDGGATTVAGMRTSLSEIGIDAAQAAQTARKSQETMPVWLYRALKRQYRRSRSR